MIDFEHFEQAFRDTERTADSALQSASALTKQAKRLRKAAKEGNVNEIKKGCQTKDEGDEAETR